MRIASFALLAAATLLLAGCSSPTDDPADPGPTGDGGLDGGSTADPGTPQDGPYGAPSSTTQVFGSGSTFAKPIIEAWGIQFADEEPKVQVSYGAGGSGKGISDITKKDVFFAASDAPLSPGEKSAANAGGHNILQFPLTLGAIGVVYNVQGVSEGLRLDGETIGKVYAGDIKAWDHPDIAALNPGVDLPDDGIAIVYRSDSSGTTYAFTDFLTRTSPTFEAKITSAASKKPDWTKSSATQLSGNGNDGVGSLVKTTPGSIGYVELAYVKSLALKAAHVKSHDGAFVAPSSAGASKAAAGQASTFPAPDGDWSTVSIADAPGDGAYPISTFAYAMVYDSLASYGSKATANQQAAFQAWMWWVLHEGQQLAGPLGYAPLPAEVVELGEGALEDMH